MNSNGGQQAAACQQEGDGEEQRKEADSASHLLYMDGDLLARWLTGPAGLALQGWENNM